MAVSFRCIIDGAGFLFECIGKLFSTMICHSYTLTYFIKSSIIPIPKDARANLTDSDKYRSFAISTLLSKLRDIVIIKQQKYPTSHYQFGFNPIRSGVCDKVNDPGGGGGFKSPPSLRSREILYQSSRYHSCAFY